MNAITIKQILAIWFVFVLIQTQAQSIQSPIINSYGSSLKANFKNQINPRFLFQIKASKEHAKADSIAAKAGFMPSISASYYVGEWGITSEAGSFNNATHFDIAEYTRQIRDFSTTDISSTEWKSWFLMAGPSFQKALMGNSLFLSADILGGIIKMKPASFSIYDTESGKAIADYYMKTRTSSAQENPLFAIKPNLRLEWYPNGGPIGLNLTANYLQVFGSQNLSTYSRDMSNVKFDGVPTQEIRAQVLTAPLVESHTKGPINNFGFGGGISFQITGSKEPAAEQASLKKHVGPVKYQDFASKKHIGGVKYENIGSVKHAINTKGTGGSKREIVENGQVMNQDNCGPVTQKIILPDGSIEETTFACPDDAASYKMLTKENPTRLSANFTPDKQTQGSTFGEKANAGTNTMPNRISMNVTVPKQTQGATFGEKVNQGLHAAGSVISQGAYISGNISWDSESNGIITNQNAAVTSVGNLAGGAGGGAAVASYAATGRSAGAQSNQGTALTIYAREAGSGLATGRRQYQPLFIDGQGNVCTECIAKVSSNPVFKENNNQGENPLYKNSGANNEQSCNGIAGLTVSLIDEASGTIVARTQTEACGDFFFANLPQSSYLLKLSGELIETKSYDIQIDKNGRYDLAGETKCANNQWIIKLISGQNENPEGDEKVNAGLHAAGGALSQGASLLGGTLPGGAVISAAVSSYFPSDPIPGVDVMLGKKSAGSNLKITGSDENGVFEFLDLKKGDYTLRTTLIYTIDDLIPVITGDLDQDGNSERKGWDGTVKGNSISSDPQIRKGWDGTVKGNSISSDPQTRKGWDGTVKGNAVANNDLNQNSGMENAPYITDQEIINTAKSTIQDFKKSMDELDKMLNMEKSPSSKEINQTKDQNSKVRNRINELETVLKNIGLLGRTASPLADIQDKTKAMDEDVRVLLKNLNQLGDKYESISNVLKTKHDTVKNSVGNIR
ncbi:MAG: hypothetical protein IH594_17625 [Bacteroidales bacterium]|nr:hypothetical protein [Bacteroidales bacterium]